MSQYFIKIKALINYIEENLAEPLTLSALSKKSAISPFHLHRLFSAQVKQPLRQYVQTRRLIRAAHQVYLRDQDITDIAFDAGYQSLEAFSRAFKNKFKQSPRDFRLKPNSQPWLTNPTFASEETHMTQYNHNDVSIIDFPRTLVATYRHQGDPANIMASVQHFIQWRKTHHTPPDQSKTFNLLYSDPEQAEPNTFIFDICAETKHELSNEQYQIFSQIIPKMKCAKLHYQGPDQGLAAALNFLYGEWLNHTDETLADFPCIIERLTMYPDVAPHQATLNIYLPLQ
ncbi:GyrI-like domain-containing protein [Thalassotalea sp. 1_MG-2023]|uniref:AraC family transcriptional regulator n=1 Tax=Thalassotalea sp. 1_MG-2023 TaxID=3062680 RepID=UPI0026E3DAD7|nr:GyrI-like domain-containing protein [Thalassotalea sp. 1_MG-2023]MDO6428390.1 GyrI-like domain-containing protein [Thalassotalea sp. 1_MG-2023]